jgi:L-ribulose-5-phosphate 4-epimerase
MSETGYVKYRCEHRILPPEDFVGFEELNAVRSRLHQLGFIGRYANGIGFGNISIRAGASNHFYISGTMTGVLPELTPAQYTKVVAWDFPRNWLRCEGPIQASSESMTHAAIYEQDATARAVLHIHAMELWKRLLDRVPTTRKHVEYGTPEMAAEMGRLFRESDVRERRILAMAGHEEGIFAFGPSLEEAFGVLQAAQKIFTLNPR